MIQGAVERAKARTLEHWEGEEGLSEVTHAAPTHPPAFQELNNVQLCKEIRVYPLDQV